MIKALSLVVEKEEQFVLYDRTADGTAEHIPAQRGLLGSVETVLPRVRVELVVAEKLPKIAVKLLVPDLMVVLTIPPWKFPNSAEAFW